MDETEEMVKLLLSRAKMLGHHCPRCNLPLFDKNGEIECVKCGRIKVVNEGEEEGSVPVSESNKDASSVRLVLKEKRNDLLAMLKTEKDPDKISSLVEAISKVDGALKK